MFGHCIVVALTAVLHPVHDHLFFYGLLLIFGGLSTVRMVFIEDFCHFLYLFN